MVKELQSKSEKIKSLNEKIGTLSESDKALKQNAELKLLNGQLKKEQQSTEQRAGAMISSVNEECARKEWRLAQTQAEATRSQQAELVKEKAALEYSSRKEALEREYRGKTLGYQILMEFYKADYAEIESLCRVLCQVDKGYNPHQHHFTAHSGTRCIYRGTVVCDGLETSQGVLLKLWTGDIDTPSFCG